MKYLLQLLLVCGISYKGFIGAQSPLTRFSADSHEKELIISWTLATGKTCNGIRILRSDQPDGDFQQIGYIGGICGSINDTVSYNFTDSSPKINQNQFYVLDLAELGYSDTLIAFVSYAPESQALIQWSPDLQQYRMHLHQRFTPPVHLKVMNLEGKELTFYFSEEVPFWFSLMDLAPGPFVIQVMDSNGSSTRPQFLFSFPK